MSFKPRCEACKTLVHGLGWFVFDGRLFHSECKPATDTNADALASIDRLTAQVAAMKAERDEAIYIAALCYRIAQRSAASIRGQLLKRVGPWRRVKQDIIDAYRYNKRQAHAEKQAQWKELERQRDEARIQVEVERGEVQRLQESLTACVQERDRLKASIAMTDKNFRAMQKRHDEYRDALVVADAWIDDVAGEFKNDAYMAAVKQIYAALNPAPPSTVETCKWCSRPPRAGDNVCQQCRDSHAKHSTQMFAPPVETPAPTCRCVHCGRESEAPFVFCPKCGECNPAPVDRDASVDAPTDVDMYEAEVDIAKLRAELDAANEETARLQALFQQTHGVHHDWVWEGKKAQEALSATTAKLGRAVGLVGVLANHLESAANVIVDCDVLEPEDDEDQEIRDLIAAARAFAADADSTAAGEAYQRDQDELAILRRLERAVFSGNALACSPEVPKILIEYLKWSRAAVDARRETVKP